MKVDDKEQEETSKLAEYVTELNDDKQKENNEKKKTIARTILMRYSRLPV